MAEKSSVKMLRPRLEATAKSDLTARIPKNPKSSRRPIQVSDGDSSMDLSVSDAKRLLAFLNKAILFSVK